MPVVLLEAAAYLDWLYPHMAYRPVGDLRLALRGEDGARFAERVKGALALVRTEHEGRTAVFSDGTLTVVCQEGLFAGAPPDAPLFARSTPYRVFGPSAAPSLRGGRAPLHGGRAGAPGAPRPAPHLRRPPRAPRASSSTGPTSRSAPQALGLSRALHGATLLAAHFFPEVADAAARVRPALSGAERLAVERSGRRRRRIRRGSGTCAGSTRRRGSSSRLAPDARRALDRGPGAC